MPPDRDDYDVDLGDGHYLKFFSWNPDDLPQNRELYNVPPGEPMPKVKRCGASVYHDKPDGTPCGAAVYFKDVAKDEAYEKAFGDRTAWTVESWDPLTLSPSLLCMVCGDHGFIRNGKWVRV